MKTISERLLESNKKINEIVKEISDTDITEGIFDIFKPAEWKAGEKARKGSEQANLELMKKGGEFEKTKTGYKLKGVTDPELIKKEAVVKKLLEPLQKDFKNSYDQFLSKVQKNLGNDIEAYPDSIKTLLALLERAAKAFTEYINVQ